MRKVFLEELNLPKYRNVGVNYDYLINKNIRFIYDEEEGYLYVKQWEDKRKGKLLVIYKYMEFIITTTTIRKSMIGNIVNNIYIKNRILSECIEETYEKKRNLTICSEKIVKVKCPNCGQIRTISCKDLFKLKHVPCKKCSDSKSYPEKFMFSFLQQLGLSFECEYIINYNNKNLRYDFYIKNKKLVIETDGIQHKDKNNIWYLGNDIVKDSIANENGLRVIRIDCSVSDPDFIKKSILKSEIIDFFDVSNINWNDCHINACNSLVIEVNKLFEKYQYDLNKIASILKISRQTVRRYLSYSSKVGLCEFDKNILNEIRKNKIKKKNIERCSKSIKVIKDGIELGEHDSISELCRNSKDIYGKKFSSSHVSQIANKLYGRKTHFGYTFEFST